MKKITLTFDNGPDPGCTPKVLEVLRARNIKATFFVCGQGNTLHPALKAKSSEGMALLEKIDEAGHWIGNHSLTHMLCARGAEAVAQCADQPDERNGLVQRAQVCAR